MSLFKPFKTNPLYYWIKLLRIDQWIKNFFIFAPALFGFKFDSFPILMAGFLCFSLVASSLYILNDYFDIENDKQHPDKKNRPFVTKAIQPHLGLMVMGGIFLSAICFSLFISLSFTAILACYFFMNILYTLYLKHIALLDIIVISFGFLLRIYAGSLIGNVTLSHWIILVTFLLALLLAMGKRREELILLNQGKKVRKNIENYTLEFINIGMTIMASVTIVGYIMYTLSPEVTVRLQSPHLYLTSIFVIIGILRYLQLTFVFNQSGNPSQLILKDLFLKISILCFLISFLIVVRHG